MSKHIIDISPSDLYVRKKKNKQTPASSRQVSAGCQEQERKRREEEEQRKKKDGGLDRLLHSLRLGMISASSSEGSMNGIGKVKMV